MQEQAWCPEGSEHGLGGLRMAPEGPVAPSGPPRPDLDSRGLVMHFRSRARLRRLLVRLRRPTPQRSLRSLRRRGFALYVRLRHYRSSLFCCRKIIPSHSFAALTALVVRRINGNGDQPILACTSSRTPPRRGIGVRTRPRHLAAAALTALVVRRVNGDVALFVRLVNGFADRPRPACTGSPHAPRWGIGVRTRQRRILPPVGFRGNAPDRRRHLPLPGGDGAAEAASDENRAEAAVAPDAGCRAEVAGAPAFDQSGFADQGA